MVEIISGVKIHVLEMMAERMRISLNRFRKGGAAMLEAEAMNHHIDIVGNRVRNPFVRNRLRVCVVSYDTPASENKAGEERPWASIIAKAPAQPQEVIERVPAIISPICATEE